MPAIAEPVVSPPTPPSVAITADKLTIPEKKWNTANLSKRLGIDVASAATASILVSPIITIVDQ